MVLHTMWDISAQAQASCFFLFYFNVVLVLCWYTSADLLTWMCVWMFSTPHLIPCAFYLIWHMAIKMYWTELNRVESILTLCGSLTPLPLHPIFWLSSFSLSLSLSPWFSLVGHTQVLSFVDYLCNSRMIHKDILNLWSIHPNKHWWLPFCFWNWYM